MNDTIWMLWISTMWTFKSQPFGSSFGGRASSYGMPMLEESRRSGSSRLIDLRIGDIMMRSFVGYSSSGPTGPRSMSFRRIDG